MDEGSPASRPEWLWRWYRDLVERVPAVPYLAEPGPAGVWTYVSPQIERLLGFTPDEWLADPELWSRQIHPDDRERVVEHELAVWEEATAGDPESLPLVSNEYRMLTRDGRTLWVRDEAFVATDHEGRPSALRGLLLDITEQKRAEMALRAGEARLREAQEIAHVGSWEWDVESDTVTWSDELYRIFGLGVADLTPTRDGVMDRIHPDDHERAARAVDEALRGKPLDTELRVVRPDGTVRVVHARAKVTPDDAGNPARLTGTAMDVTERKALEEALAHQAFYDPLTDLANRALFTDRTRHALAAAPRLGASVAVLILDVDRFKAVNDTLGHTTGDQLLRELADRLRDCLRPADTAARLGGDEFAVLIEDAGVAGAVRVAERIVERLKAPFLIAGTEVFVDVSTGIAESRAPDGVEELLQNADAAMYAAKREGKASYQVFEPQAHGGVLRILELGTELRRAVEREEFILHYQPVVTLPLGRLTGMEALVRWQHPRRGLIPPGDFIPVAEETGLIVSLDRWVLQEACRQARDWQARFPRNQGLDMHVNISARQLHHADLVPQVSEVLRETGIDPATLTIEITEGVLMQDSEATMAGLHALRELGVRLAIDDFGVGFSSLNYLRKLPVDVVKIDRSFVTGIAAGAEEWGLAKGIIRLVHDLGLETVAEGIEQAEQVAHLQALGCDRGQGYYFARPAPPGAIEEILDGRDTRSAIRRGA